MRNFGLVGNGMKSAKLLDLGTDKRHMVGRSAEELVEEFQATDFSPTGEWWVEFPVGLTFEYGGTRWADVVAITSRNSSHDLRSASEAQIRDRLGTGWLEGERVAIIEVKAEGDKDSWKALGQLQIYEKLFEMDWDATIEELIILAHESVPGRDSIELLKNHFSGINLYVYSEGQFQ